MTGKRLPYFQSSFPQYQARCPQSSTGMVNTERNKCQNNKFASTCKRYMTTTVLNFTTCGWRYVLLNGAVSIVELCQIIWDNDHQGASSGQLQGTYPGICLESLMKSMKIVVKIRDTLRFNLLSFWMQVLVPAQSYSFYLISISHCGV